MCYVSLLVKKIRVLLLTHNFRTGMNQQQRPSEQTQNRLKRLTYLKSGVKKCNSIG